MANAADKAAPKTIECDSWEHFCQAIRPGDRTPLDPIYRGHADCEWSLVPPIARAMFEQVRLAQEGGLDVAGGGPASPGQVGYFRHLATGLPGFDVTTLEEIDVEALARHHGLCSNLLDWTSSPYVAAFFAFTTALDLANEGRLSAGTLSNSPIMPVTRPVCVWRLGLSKDLYKDGEFEILSSLANVNYWQKAQQGVFTRLTHQQHLDLTSYLAERGELQRLCRFAIPGAETGKALSDLEAMNITYASLFPDLRGAALQANMGMTWRFLP